MSATTVLNLASEARTANGETDPFSVGDFTELALDADITAVSGSSTPTLTFFYERLKADGATYSPIWQSDPITSTSDDVTTSIGAGLAYNQSFAGTGKLRWTITGTTPSFTFSASIIGK